MNSFRHNSEENYIEIIQRLVKCIVVLLVIIVVLLIFLTKASSKSELKAEKNEIKTPAEQTTKKAKDLSETLTAEFEKMSIINKTNC